MASDYTRNLKEDGFVIIQNFLTSSEVLKYRGAIEGCDNLQRNNYCSERQVPELNEVFSDFHQKVTDFLSKDMGSINEHKQVDVWPPTQLMYNYMPDVVNTRAYGWHFDAGGESSNVLAKKILRDENYQFGKVGLYLQDNGIIGGGIDIVPKSHLPLFSNYLKRKLISGFSLLTILSKKVGCAETVVLWLDQKLFALMGAERLPIKRGTVVLFDSRLLHRGSPVESAARHLVEFCSDDLSMSPPEDQNKYVLYCHYGTHFGASAYILDRSSQPCTEIRLWKNEWQILNR